MVRLGCDVLLAGRLDLVRGRRLGLVTNHTGLGADGALTRDRLAACPETTLAALFAPEHGIAGTEDREGLADGRDEATGVAVHSLYGYSREPDREVLAGLDAVLYDIQDVGARFYTYVSTLSNVMRVAGQVGTRVVVLDRPNPVGGWVVEGPVLDSDLRSFVGAHEIAMRHGLTVGELARGFRDAFGVACDLEVVPCEGWRRGMLGADAGLPWVGPSPNLHTLDQALLYTGPCLLEFSNLSVGRGTPTPFEVVGAPWVDAERVASAVAECVTPGVRVEPARFRPAADSTYPHRGEECRGVRLVLTDPRAYRALPLGLALLVAFRDGCPEFALRASGFEKLLGSARVRDAYQRGAPWSELADLAEEGVAAFVALRQDWMLYPE